MSRNWKNVAVMGWAVALNGLLSSAFPLQARAQVAPPEPAPAPAPAPAPNPSSAPSSVGSGPLRAPSSANEPPRSAPPNVPGASRPIDRTAGGPISAAMTTANAVDMPAESVPGADGTQKPLSNLERLDAEARDTQAIVIGVSGGLALGATEGYPPGDKFRGVPELYGSTPLLVGFSNRLTLLAALHPMFNVGVFVGFGSQSNARWSNVAGGGGLRLEAFPFASLCGCELKSPFLAHASRAFGIYGDFGIGSVSAKLKEQPASGGKVETIGGVQALLGVGLFYEFRLGTNFVLGPDLRYEVVTTTNADHNSFNLGLRFAWYPGRK
jgi:hypothetical protein